MTHAISLAPSLVRWFARSLARSLPLTSVLLCGLRSRIWDRQCGRAGVGSADIGGGPRVTLRPSTWAAIPNESLREKTRKLGMGRGSEEGGASLP